MPEWAVDYLEWCDWASLTKWICDSSYMFCVFLLGPLPLASAVIGLLYLADYISSLVSSPSRCWSRALLFPSIPSFSIFMCLFLATPSAVYDLFFASMAAFDEE